ncbi:hypothetical protein [Methylobacterium sp. CM6257]
MRGSALLAAVLHRLEGIRPRKREADRFVPLRQWPQDEAAWLDENGARHPTAARDVLSALGGRGPRGPYAARPEGDGVVVAGPVSALALSDAQAEIRFVFRVTLFSHGEEAF